ncbi:MAG: hypothetical protein ACRDDF_06185, partial [Aeromonas sp.]
MTAELWYTNACSLKGKWGELFARCTGSEVVAITETWLRSEHSVDANILQNYIPYRQDRIDGRHGGGVLLLIRSFCNQWESSYKVATPNIQAISCQVQMGKKMVGILCVYRAPQTEEAEDITLMSIMQEFTKSSPFFIIIGDFNLPNINWHREWAPSKSTSEELLDWLHKNAFRQHIKHVTRCREGQNPSILDLLITRHVNDIDSITISDPLGKSDHCVIQANLTIRHSIANPKWKRRYGEIDVVKLVGQAEKLLWVPSKANPTLEERWERIKVNLHQLTDQFAPLVPPKSRNRPKWWTPKIERSVKRRRQSWQAYRIKPTVNTWARYKFVRNETQSLQRQAKLNFEIKLAQRSKAKPKAFYAYVQSSKNMRQGVGTLEKGDGSKAHEDAEKAAVLSQFFQTVYRTSGTLPRNGLERTAKLPLLEELMVEEEAVFMELTSLNRHKSAGADGLHPAIIQSLAGVIIKPILELFVMSLKSGKIPDDWKMAEVVAIYKSGSKTKVENYRPVSLTSIFSKVLEKIVRKQLC